MYSFFTKLFHLFFDCKSSLLTGDQLTFIGVIATLAVLSVTYRVSGRRRRRSSNLLVDLIGEHQKDVDEYLHGLGKKKLEDEINTLKDGIQKKYKDFVEGLKQTNTKESEKITSLELDMGLTYQRAVQEELTRLYFKEELIKKEVDKELDRLKKPSYIHVHTSVFMSFISFVLCVAVMTIHFLCFSKAFNGLFLFLIDGLFTIIILSCWTIYIIDWKNQDEKRGEQWGKMYTKPINKWVASILSILLVLVFLMVKMKWIIKTFILFFVIVLVSFCLCCKIKRKIRYKNYNIGTIAMYTVFGMTIVFCVAIVLVLTMNYSFLYKIAPFWLQRAFDLCMDNLAFISNKVSLWQVWFIILLVLNAFIIPLLISYYRHELLLKLHLRKIKLAYKKGKKSINKLGNKLHRLKKKIDRTLAKLQRMENDEKSTIVQCDNLPQLKQKKLQIKS